MAKSHLILQSLQTFIMWSIKSPILAPKMSINLSFLGLFLFRDPGALIPGFRDAENHRDPGISGSREIPMKALPFCPCGAGVVGGASQPTRNSSSGSPNKSADTSFAT